MKGQHDILIEILLFAIGISLTGYVILNYQTIENKISSTSVHDQFNNVADVVESSIIKAAGRKVVIGFRIPDKVSNHAYKIEIGNNYIIVQSYSSPETRVTRQLFNMGNYNIRGEVNSNAGYAEIVSDSTNIELKRTDYD